jgi:hypothetical protein
MTDSFSSPAPAPTNSLAIASLIAGLAAWLLGGLGTCGTLLLLPPLSLCTGPVFLIGSIVAIVTGHMGRSQIRSSGGAQTGDGIALTGLALGWAGGAVMILLVCFGVLSFFGLMFMAPRSATCSQTSLRT